VTDKDILIKEKLDDLQKRKPDRAFLNGGSKRLIGHRRVQDRLHARQARQGLEGPFWLCDG
jgi:hypothetical protein